VTAGRRTRIVAIAAVRPWVYRSIRYTCHIP
jgi:hypothetical protein